MRPGSTTHSEPILGLAHPDDRPAESGRPLRRWLEFGAAAVALVIGAGWLLLPPDKSVNAANAGPVANATGYATPPPWPAADGHGRENLPKGFRGSPPPAPLELGYPEADRTGAAPAEQYLATMHVFAGPKNVRPRPPAARTSTMPCATGQGGDLFREVRYRLRGEYPRADRPCGHPRPRPSPTATVRVHILGVDGTLLDRDVGAGPGV